jgi:hypothetical protein
MTAVALASLILLAAAPPAVDPDIRGTTTCPTPGEVLDRLRPLLPGRGGLPPATWLRLVDGPAVGGAPAEIEVRLERANERAPAAVRRIARDGSCGETADIVAVVLASWGSLFTSVPVASVDPPPLSPSETVTATGPPAAPPVGGGARRMTLGAAAGIAAAPGGGVAPVIGIDLEIPLSGAAAARLAAAGVGEHETTFGTVGRAAWRRVLLLPALAWTSTWGPSGPFSEVSVGPLAGLLLVEGRGFATNDSNVTVDLGGAANARLGVRLTRAAVAFWLGGGTFFYARRQEVRADGLSLTLALPRWEVTVTAGAAWAPGR